MMDERKWLCPICLEEVEDIHEHLDSEHGIDELFDYVVSEAIPLEKEKEEASA